MRFDYEQIDKAKKNDNFNLFFYSQLIDQIKDKTERVEFTNKILNKEFIKKIVSGTIYNT